MTSPAPGPAQPDPRLYNADLAPATERKWGTYSIFALWMSDTHAISNYTSGRSVHRSSRPEKSP
jgi:NCS1 family nucleobase:cation symporter-1